MADRTSAALFGDLFKMFAKDPTPESKKFAETVWKKHVGNYHFAIYQMYCDSALVKLGLATRVGKRLTYAAPFDEPNEEEDD